MFIFNKYNYFSSFETGNCISNSSFNWQKKKTIQNHKGISPYVYEFKLFCMHADHDQAI